MKKYSFFIYLIFLLIVSACRTSKYSDNRRFLKEYAFCKCLRFASPDSLIFLREISASIYRDVANYSLDVYDEIDSIARIKALSILPSIIPDHEGKKAVFFSCFSYYHSKELDAFVKKMDNRIIKN